MNSVLSLLIYMMFSGIIFLLYIESEVLCLFNIYCDESCHLENDDNDIMVLGAMSCPSDYKVNAFNEIRSIKTKHGLDTRFEIKWTKVSESKADFYLELIDYFFDHDFLRFRGVLAKEKSALDFESFHHTYDDWYYKMYYLLLNPIIYPDESYNIMIDIKDTRGGKKIKKLHEVLSNSRHDFGKEIIKNLNQINSRDSEILQLCDLFIGAIAYYNRGLYHQGRNTGKIRIIDYIIKRTGKSLSQKTPPYESKFNLFIWEPQKRGI